MLAALTLIAAVAHAEEAKFEKPKEGEELKPKPETHLSAQIGGNWTTGNVENWAVNVAATFDHKWKRNQIGAVAGVAIGQTIADTNADGFLSDEERGPFNDNFTENTRRYSLDVRYDRFLSKRDSLYVLVGGLVDTFAGYDYRLHGQIGYSRTLVDTKKTSLKAELGADVARENYVPTATLPDATLIAANVNLDFAYKFNDNVGFSDLLNVYEPLYPDYADLRIKNSASISARLTNVMSVNLANVLTWRNKPPELTYIDESGDSQTATLRNIDSTTTVSLVASIL